jgi:hypothetical protein
MCHDSLGPRLQTNANQIHYVACAAVWRQDNIAIIIFIIKTISSSSFQESKSLFRHNLCEHATVGTNPDSHGVTQPPHSPLSLSSCNLHNLPAASVTVAEAKHVLERMIPGRRQQFL